MKFITQLIGLLCALSTFAATETHTVFVPFQFTDFSETVVLPQFNPTNGALINATLKLELTLETGTKIENRDSVPYPAIITGSEVWGDIPGYLTGYSKGTFTNSLSAYDGVTDFAGTSGAVNPTQYVTTTNSVSLVPATVTGTGTIPFTFDAYGSSVYEGPGDYSFLVSTRASAKFVIVYEFIPECEPTPPVCPPKPVCEPKPPVCKPTYRKRR